MVCPHGISPPLLEGTLIDVRIIRRIPATILPCGNGGYRGRVALGATHAVQAAKCGADQRWR
jgi:hypothetical protein